MALLCAACGSDEPTPDTTSETFTVTLNLNAADAQGQPEPQDVQQGQPATQPPDPTREGYRFQGWFTDLDFQNAFNFGSPITASAALYARWEEIPSYAVTVELNAADAQGKPDPQNIQEDNTANRPQEEPTRNRYTFEGWLADEDLNTPFNFKASINANTIMYAKWTLVKYTIPDDTFRAYLLQQIPDAFTNEQLDTTHGGKKLENPQHS